MGYTTFTGPVRAGNIVDTSGNTPGVNVSNVGQVVMAQVAAVAENPSVITTISIPAYSQILSIEFRSTVAFVNGISIGNTTDGTTIDTTYFSNAAAVISGLTTISTTTALQNAHWLNVGYPDSQIVVSGGAVGGAGRGVLVVTYLQGPNGNA